MDTQSATDELKAKIEEVGKTKGHVLEVVQYPDPRLSQVSKPILGDIKSDAALQRLIQDMLATMKAYRAVGLAAIQVGVDARLLVVQDQRQQPVVVINPIVRETDTARLHESEGCLSFPDLFLQVWRPADVVIEFFNENGEKQTTIADKLLGRAIQHEIDHLDGKTFIDRLPKIRRKDVLRKYEMNKRKRAVMIEKLVAKSK